MKEQIIIKIKTIKNEGFISVKFIDDNLIAAYSYSFKEKKHIFRIYKIDDKSILIEKVIKQKHYKELGFIDKNNFGVIQDEHVTIYNPKDNKEHTYKIKNPIKKIYKKDFSQFILAHRLNNEKILFTIQDAGFYSSKGFNIYKSSRYFSILKYYNKKILFKKVQSAKWITKMNQPKYEKFSELSNNIEFHKKHPSDWLGITSISSNSKNIFFYTNGGCVTRVKSGVKFEISEIGILDLNLNIIKVEKINTNGYGTFSSDGRFFIQQEYKNERNLFIYKLSDFSCKCTRITPKKHLGDIKKYAKADILNNKLLLFNHSDIAISYIKK